MACLAAVAFSRVVGLLHRMQEYWAVRFIHDRAEKKRRGNPAAWLRERMYRSHGYRLIGNRSSSSFSMFIAFIALSEL